MIVLAALLFMKTIRYHFPFLPRCSVLSVKLNAHKTILHIRNFSFNSSLILYDSPSAWLTIQNYHFTSYSISQQITEILSSFDKDYYLMLDTITVWYFQKLLNRSIRKNLQSRTFRFVSFILTILLNVKPSNISPVTRNISSLPTIQKIFKTI